jgi:hypothetical protein
MAQQELDSEEEFDPDEQAWLTSCDPWGMWRLLPWVGGYSGHQRKHLLLTVAIVRAVESAMADPRSRAVIPIAEAFADGGATDDEMERAHEAARAAYDEAPPANSAAALAARKLWHVWSDLGEAAEAAIEAETATASPEARPEASRRVVQFMRDVFGNPFRPPVFESTWRTANTTKLAQEMYESRDFAAMPILADALEEAGCTVSEILSHCRGDGPHVRGCWVVDRVLGKE